ncbi:hypothetical protein CAP35_08240 [Chitinophagaceae bacterium IBVUCB1]|nr:hypothetical protein CAP35_08240 [Chitinophagaceae bacterium IBVUCB1]
MIIKNYTLVEWNQQQQIFHMNRVINGVADHKPNTCGYKTVLRCLNDEEAYPLIEYIITHIKQETTTSEGIHLTTAQVKRHLKAAMKLITDFKQLELETISSN